MNRSRPARHQCELTANPAKKVAANRRAAAVKENLPAGLAQPALRALAGAGIKNLQDFARFSEAELLELHGMGPKAMATIHAALTAAKIALKVR